MDSFDDKLGKLLSNPEALSKMMELAKSFSDSESVPADSPEEPENSKPDKPAESLTPAAPDLAGLLGKLDPNVLSGVLRLAGEWGRGDDRRVTLLSALRPYVRSERRSKLDRAVEIVRLARLARSGLGFLGGGERHV